MVQGRVMSVPPKGDAEAGVESERESRQGQSVSAVCGPIRHAKSLLLQRRLSVRLAPNFSWACRAFQEMLHKSVSLNSIGLTRLTAHSMMAHTLLWLLPQKFRTWITSSFSWRPRPPFRVSKRQEPMERRNNLRPTMPIPACSQDSLPTPRRCGRKQSPSSPPTRGYSSLIYLLNIPAEGLEVHLRG